MMGFRRNLQNGRTLRKNNVFGQAAAAGREVKIFGHRIPLRISLRIDIATDILQKEWV